jgi:hypothetical protein
MKKYLITFDGFARHCEHRGRHKLTCSYHTVVRGLAGMSDCKEELCPVLNNDNIIERGPDGRSVKERKFQRPKRTGRH